MYNVEQYIGKCLDSCLNQDLSKDEYEIVVVDDGSPDNSSRIVEEFMKRYSNIRLINRENGGLSAARNTGIREAKGEYVWFVDSDDWIETNILKYLMSEIYKNRLDALCFNLMLVYSDGLSKSYHIKHGTNEKVFKGDEFLCVVDMPPAAWAAIYKKNFLIKNSLYFYEGILHEDQEFTPRAYFLANRIMFVDKVCYYYFQRVGGIMKSKQNHRRCIDLLTVADSLYEFSNSIKSTNGNAYLTVLNKVSFAFSQSLAYFDSNAMDLELYKSKPYYPLSINSLLSLKESIKYRIINLSIGLYLAIYKMK